MATKRKADNLVAKCLALYDPLATYYRNDDQKAALSCLHDHLFHVRNYYDLARRGEKTWDCACRMIQIRLDVLQALCRINEVSNG